MFWVHCSTNSAAAPECSRGKPPGALDEDGVDDLREGQAFAHHVERLVAEQGVDEIAPVDDVHYLCLEAPGVLPFGVEPQECQAEVLGQAAVGAGTVPGVEPAASDHVERVARETLAAARKPLFAEQTNWPHVRLRPLAPRDRLARRTSYGVIGDLELRRGKAPHREATVDEVVVTRGNDPRHKTYASRAGHVEECAPEVHEPGAGTRPPTAVS